MALLMLASYSGAFGGAERVALDWLEALPGERWVACPDGRLADEARRRGFAVARLRLHRTQLRARARDRMLTPYRVVAHGRECRSRARDLGADLVLACGMRTMAGLVLTRRDGGPPIVFEHHDLPTGRVLRAVVAWLAGRADIVVVPSAVVARSLAPAASRARVVPPGVDPDHLAVPAAPQVPGSPVFLALGAIIGWKRLDVALEALSAARREVPGARLHIVGEPLPEGHALLEVLRARAAEPDLAGAVDFRGRREASAALAAADALVHCATNEPYGVVLLEAMAASRPVIGPAAAGPAEILAADCALLCPPADVSAYAGAMVRLARDPDLGTRLGAAGRRRVLAGPTRERSGAAFAAAVDPLLPGPPGRSPAAEAVTVITVTRNSGADLERLLASLERHLPGAHVVAVDCASSDDSAGVARRPRDRITVESLSLTENVGFGRAVNQGMASVRRPVTLLLNPDVQLIDGSLSALVAALAEPGAPDRLLAPLVMNMDGTRQQTAHPRPASIQDALRAVLPGRVLPAAPAALLWPWRSRRRRTVGWAVGCAVAARTSTLLRLGPFDARLFLYGEDLALGLDAARRGVPTEFWPDARVLHAGGHATAAELGTRRADLLATTRMAVVRDRLGLRSALIDAGLQLGTFWVRWVGWRILGEDARSERTQVCAQLRAIRRAGLLSRDVGRSEPSGP